MIPSRVCIKKAELKKRGYSDFAEWASDPKHLYIGRNMNFYVKGATKSIWANPYNLKKYSLTESLAFYEEYVRDSDLYDKIPNLKNYTELGCWCMPPAQGTPEQDDISNVVCCHGDVLIKLLKSIK